jgi:hypothetical protein
VFSVHVAEEQVAATGSPPDQPWTNRTAGGLFDLRISAISVERGVEPGFARTVGAWLCIAVHAPRLPTAPRRA